MHCSRNETIASSSLSHMLLEVETLRIGFGSGKYKIRLISCFRLLLDRRTDCISKESVPHHTASVLSRKVIEIYKAMFLTDGRCIGF